MRIQPLHFKIPTISGESIRIEHWDFDHFYEVIHYHEECQLTYIIEGNGTIFIGPTIANFQAGDAFLIGKNLPHVLRNGEEYHVHNPKLHARAISIFFKADSFLSLFQRLPESAFVDKLLKYSVYGISIPSEATTQLYADLIKLSKMVGFERIAFLLLVLDKISRNKSLKFVSPTNIPIDIVTKDISKISEIFDFLNRNYQRQITLKEIASLAFMTPCAFCRFFKLRTQKTFSRFLIEIRIGMACKFIVSGKYNSTEACFESGYNNVSNFHRHFKHVTGMTPSEYKKKFEKIIIEEVV